MRGDLHYTLTAAQRFNIVPGQDAPVGLTRQGAHEIAPLRWGVLPRWRGHGGKRAPMIHAAPYEAVPGTPQLRDAFKKQRCLVFADGCYAWRELKQPIWFHPEPRCVVAFAGVWTVNEDGIASFAILMGPPLVTRVRAAMPIVMRPAAFDAWLDPKLAPDRAIALLAIGEPLLDWRADTVSTRMSSGQIDDASCIAPLGNPNQRELF